MVNGDAAAGGCDLALACDIRIGSERTRFMESFARIGLFPGTGGCWFLPRMVGSSKAAEMIFTGDPIGAQEAYQWGLLSQLVPHEELLGAHHDAGPAHRRRPADRACGWPRW